MSLTIQPENGVGGMASMNLRATPPARPIEATTFWPTPPGTVEETGLIAPVIEDHLIRMLYFSQQATGSELATMCGVTYVVIQPLVNGLVPPASRGQ